MVPVTPEDMGEQSAELLRSFRVPLQPGLTDTELATVQANHGFEFCPEHKAFLQTAVPTGRGWPNWRTDSDELREQLAAPSDGVLFDVLHNNFWPADWGPRPGNQYSRDEHARERLALLPKLIPVYGHRYLPAAPAPEPAPVLSVVQTDVSCYGRDLLRYLRHEFGGQARNTDYARPVEFWSDLA